MGVAGRHLGGDRQRDAAQGDGARHHRHRGGEEGGHLLL